MPASLFQLKVTLLECEPLIWRRLLVSRSMTLAGLHRVIQEAMGWQDYHLFEFEAGEERYGLPDPDDSHDPTVPAGKVRVSKVLRSAGDKLLYSYDFGDGWCMEVLLEDLPSASEHKTWPRCLDGERAAPPEDCGGPWGYMEWLEQLGGPDKRERREARAVLGPRFDPARFDIKAINRHLTAFALRSG